MKNLTLIFFCMLCTLSINFAASAKESLDTKIDSKRLKEVRGYLNNSKFDLDRGLMRVESVAIEEKEAYLADIITSLLANSFGNNEFLMRDSLRRTQIVYLEFLKIPKSNSRDYVVRRFLSEQLKIAQSLYQIDEKLLSGNQLADDLRPVEFAKIGINFTEYLLNLYINLPSNELRLNVLAEVLGLLYNDILNDDVHNRLLANIAEYISVFYNTNKSEIESLRSKSGDPQYNEAKLIMARKIFSILQQSVILAKQVLGKVITSNNNKNNNLAQKNSSYEDIYFELLSTNIFSSSGARKITDWHLNNRLDYRFYLKVYAKIRDISEAGNVAFLAFNNDPAGDIYFELLSTDYFSSSSARKIVNLHLDNELDYRVFLKVYAKVRDFDEAILVAKETFDNEKFKLR